MKKILCLLLIFATLFIVSCQKQPKASFDVAGSNFKTGESVNFTNTSEDAASYEWDFGDGAKSTDKSPSHSYATQGSYLVTLTAFSKNEKKKSSASNSVSITASNTGGGSGSGLDFNYSPANPVVGDLVSFTSQTTATSVSWDFGDGGSSNLLNPTHTFNSAGNFQVTLTADGSTKTKTVAVSNGSSSSIPGTYNVVDDCSGSIFSFSDVVSSTSQTNTYSVTKFAGYAGGNVTFSVVGNTITVPSQDVNCGNPAALRNFSGSGTIISATSFKIDYTETTNGSSISCTDTYTK
jgi:PKD repeat protein